MSAGLWLRVFVAALIVVLAFNIVVAKLARSQGEELIRGLPANGDFDHMFLGNSTMARGFDAKAYAAAAGLAEARVLKLALGGVSAEEECLLLEEFFARGNKVKQVVLGFHDLHLEGNGAPTWSSLSGAMNLIYFVPHERAQQVYQLSTAESLKVRLTRYMPMLVRRANLWVRVEQLRRSLGEIGMSAVQSTADGHEGDFKFYPYLESEREAAHEVMRGIVKSQMPFSPGLRRIVSACRQHGSSLVVMEMPLSSDRVAVCEEDERWQDYRTARAEHLKQAGVTVMSALKWSLTSDDFADPVHLKPEAAARFSIHLAKTLPPTSSL